MTEFAVRDGQFWLDGRPVFIHAGEFHYFRTPADQWAHRLGLLKQAGFNTVAAYIPWLWHQPQQDLIDLDGHTHPLRDLAGFLDLAAEMGLWIIPRPGPYIMAETINEGVPPWLFERYPQAAFIDQTGKTQNIVSYLQADFLACVEDWYEAVFSVLSPRQVTRGGRILMMQLDNEMGMIHWVRNIVDINPDTLARFSAWLGSTYGSGLAARYPASDAAFLQQEMTQPAEPYGGRVLEDYRRFFRDYLRQYGAHLWARAQAYGLEVPPVLNIHGFADAAGRAFPIGLSQLVEVMAIDGMVSAMDVYPIKIGEGDIQHLLLANEMTKALEYPQQPLFSIEFQAGGNPDHSNSQSSLHDLYSRLCISTGMRAINHYLFFDGENDPVLSPQKRHNWGHPVRKDGTLRRHYARYPRLSAAITAYGEALITAQPETVTTIGFQIDDFMTEVNNALTKPTANILTHQRDVVLFDLIARGLALTHRPFDAVELARADLDPAVTPLLWVMLERQCDVAVQHKLVEYARAGGRLVLIGRMCTETRDHQPCTILRDALGITAIASDEPFAPAEIRVFAHEDVPVRFLERYEGVFDDVFATAGDGAAVGIAQPVGAGLVMLLGAAFTADTLEDLDIVHEMANRMGCAPLFTLDEWADVRLSRGAAGSFVFVNNYQDDPLTTRISWRGRLLFDGHAMTLPARRGAILPLDWRVTDGVIVRWCTSEINGVMLDGDRLTLSTDPAECLCAIIPTGWTVGDAPSEARDDGSILVRVQGGAITLTRQGG